MRWSGAAGQCGQATVEWIGLVMGLAVAFGGALGVARGAAFGGEAAGLGEALASRVTCAAQGACAAEGRAVLGGAAPRRHALRGRPRWQRPPPAPDAVGGRGIRPSAPWERAPRGLRGLDGAGAGVLHALGRTGRSAWVICLGYRRLRYDLDHPPTPRQVVPVGETLDQLNECLNPWSFFFP